MALQDNETTSHTISLWLSNHWSLMLSGFTAYSVVVGGAYLWGYWAPFGINILDYMGASDILTATAWPLVGVLSTTLVGVFIGSHQPKESNKPDRNRVGTAMVWYWTHLRELHFLGLFLIWISELDDKWALIALLGGVPLSVYILLQDWTDSIPLSRASKLILTFILITTPPMAIYKGQTQARSLMNGSSYQAVYSEIEGLTRPSAADDASRLRLIGQRGDVVFLWDAQNHRRVLVKFPGDRPLVIGQVSAKPVSGGWSKLIGYVKGLLG